MDSASTGCGYGSLCSPTWPVQGACPKGWHLPDRDEWDALLFIAGGDDEAGYILKTSNGWVFKNGTDDFGFSALPGGAGSYEAGHGPYHYGNLVFGGWGNFAEFWTSTEKDEYGVHNVWVASNQQTYTFGANKRDALSIRCVQDY